MNYHYFVLITTIVFYIILRMYKHQIKTESKNSNLVYVLFVPVILYLTQFMYNKNGFSGANGANIINNIPVKTDSVTQSLLTAPYPDSSIDISTNI